MRYDEETILRVREANDIVSVVGERVRLTKKGANYFGLCPFHSEKTPSFSVNADKQIYHCFGCGAGGNVISFLMNYENESFVEALQSLADRAGIALPEPRADDDYKERKSLRDSLVRLHGAAAVYYHKVLMSEEGIEGLNYLLGTRGLHQATITHFGLGMTPRARDGLYRYLRDRGFGDDIISASGLVLYKETGIRDRFFSRVIFPIMDAQSHVIAFGGRVLGTGEPKYLNSPESPIFDKSSALYGINFAKRSRANGLILCEGYLDTISLHEAGFSEAVATLGTALTDKHARMLKRYTDTVYLAQDSDEAGVNAKIRAFPILHDAGLNVKVINMKGAKDPDEFIRRYGRTAYEDLIKNAENAFIYIVSAIKEGYDLSDPAAKTAFYKDVAERLGVFTDDMERLNYTEAVSRRFYIPLKELKEMTEQGAKKHGLSSASGIRPAVTAPGVPARAPKVPADATKHEELIGSWLIERPELISPLIKYIGVDEFGSELVRDLIKAILSAGSFDIYKYMDLYADEAETSARLAALMSQGSIGDLSKADIEKGLSEAVRAIKNARIERELSLAEGDIGLTNRLMREKHELSRLKVDIEDEAFS